MAYTRVVYEEPGNLEDVLREADAYFAGTAPVQKAAEGIGTTLERLGIAYAIAGGLAVGVYGAVRVTKDVDVLVTPDGLKRFKEACLGRGYVEKFAGSRGVRDTIQKVEIDFLLTGDYPGDAKPKAIAFPDPAKVATTAPRFRVVTLPALIEMKLASGMTGAARYFDLGDVASIIRVRKLPETYAESLHPYVRAKFLEIWNEAQRAEAPGEGPQP